MKRVAFLLGAGASIPAGYSSTERLTEKIRALKGYSRWTDGNYCSGTDSPETDYRTPVVRRMICWLSKQTQKYLRYRNETKAPNYEDIYYLASQLKDDASELQNPAVLPLIRKLERKMASWSEYREYCEPFPEPRNRDWNFRHFCEETCHYIEDIVADVLRTKECCTKHLEIIKDISQSDDLELKGIATLAHDTHVEEYLRSEGIKFTDGFSVPTPDDTWRIWRNQFSSCDGIPFLKLHGSVNWILLELKDPSKHERLPLSEIGVRNPLNSEPPNTGNSIYGIREDVDDRPLLLIGTFNKPAQYTRGLMLDIHYRFRKILKDTDTLVVCGYSFGDKAINTQLVFWRYAERSRSLVVIDSRCRSKVIESARYAAAELLKKKEICFIHKGMGEVEPDELLEVLKEC